MILKVILEGLGLGILLILVCASLWVWCISIAHRCRSGAWRWG